MICGLILLLVDALHLNRFLKGCEGNWVKVIPLNSPIVEFSSTLGSSLTGNHQMANAISIECFLLKTIYKCNLSYRSSSKARKTWGLLYDGRGNASGRGGLTS